MSKFFLPAGQALSLSSGTGEGTGEGTGPGSLTLLFSEPEAIAAGAGSLTLLLREPEAIAAGAGSSSLDTTISVDLMVFFLEPETGGAGAGSLTCFIDGFAAGASRFTRIDFPVGLVTGGLGAGACFDFLGAGCVDLTSSLAGSHLILILAQ